jgi:hypothetical protein
MDRPAREALAAPRRPPRDGRRQPRRRRTRHVLPARPGTRKYQLFPYYNFQNTQGAFVQLFLAPTPRLTLRLDLAANRLTEAADRWYMGSGPTQDDGVFGYVARPTGGSRDLGQDAFLTVSYRATKHLRLELFYGRAWGSAVIAALYGNADAGFGSLELAYTF